MRPSRRIGDDSFNFYTKGNDRLDPCIPADDPLHDHVLDGAAVPVQLLHQQPHPRHRDGLQGGPQPQEVRGKVWTHRAWEGGLTICRESINK